MRAGKIAIFVLAALSGGATAPDVGRYDRDAWNDDYRRVKAGMARHYANLDWARDRRGVDLADLDRRTRARIDQARSGAEAEAALGDFVAAFRDPHLELVAAEATAAGEGAGEAATDRPAGASCSAAGYAEGNHGFAPQFAAIPGRQALGQGEFPTATIGATGAIRISSFREQDYGAACARVFRPGIGERALQLAVRADLQRRLIAAIGDLKARGVRRLLVDISDNGGGSEWDREAAALFTDRVMRRAEPRIANPACDRSAVWSGARPCPVFSGRTAVATLGGTGAWTGPVLILVDGGTASAAEEFAGWLRDNSVARLIGRTTMGAGCGYVDGGAPVRLRAAPLVLRMPNCARFTGAGRNEIEGWPPDMALPGVREDAQGWVRALGRELAR